jgi:hypothetical protein
MLEGVMAKNSQVCIKKMWVASLRVLGVAVIKSSHKK